MQSFRSLRSVDILFYILRLASGYNICTNIYKALEPWNYHTFLEPQWSGEIRAIKVTVHGKNRTSIATYNFAWLKLRQQIECHSRGNSLTFPVAMSTLDIVCFLQCSSNGKTF